MLSKGRWSSQKKLNNDGEQGEGPSATEDNTELTNNELQDEKEKDSRSHAIEDNSEKKKGNWCR